MNRSTHEFFARKDNSYSEGIISLIEQLIIINKEVIKRVIFDLSKKKLNLFLLIEIEIEITRNKILKGKADDNKTIPVKKEICP